MDETTGNTTKPRKLMRFVEETGDHQKLDDDVTSHPKAGERSGTSSESGLEVTVLERREEWYGAKLRNLKDNVEQLRKTLQDKEREYLRLRNKYSSSKRRQEQLQEEIDKQNAARVDTSSEVEFLKLQLAEKEKELAENRASSTEDESLENGGKTTPEEDCGKHDSSNGVASFENCFSRSSFESRYLALHKDVRRKLVYGILGLALVSSVVALGDRSTVLSTIAVGCWTLGLVCFWSERKELLRTMKIKHLKQVREISRINAQLRQEKSKLEATKNELEKKLSEESSEKLKLASTFEALSDKIGEEMSKNAEMSKREENTLRELESERVSRRLAEQRLEEVVTQARAAEGRADKGDCGEDIEKLRECVRVEREQSEKLKRENEKLIKEMVEVNTKEEKWKMENREIEAKNKNGRKEDDGKSEKQSSEIKDGGKKNQITEVVGKKQEGKEEEWDDREKNELERKMEAIQEGVTEDSTEVDENLARCWLCVFKIPRETRVSLCVVFLVCLISFLHSVFTSKVYFLVGLLSLATLGAGGYFASCKNTNSSH